ncbi:uncharacterized protein LOC132299057 [Cornus florida]|uniref:uncharacterized protein LOC132299057 n=1 Tax=Cornus florida TaxID=4283 RepID=UPI00289755AB|nr:uncharacterized protein LOC132299057 [Cornus florida]
MDMVTEYPALTDLALTLEQATLMAKQLPNTTDPSQLLQIYSTLHSAHHHLSSFLSQTPQFHPPPPPPPPPPPLAAENSVSSAVGNGNYMDDNDNDNEPMQLGDRDDEEAEAEQNSKTTIERVEERMRDCFIQNKRPKRPLSPSAAAAEQRRWYDHELVSGSGGFDPHGTRLRSLDLVYQFHG